MTEPKPCPFCNGKSYISFCLGKEYVDSWHDGKCLIRPNTWFISHRPISTQIKIWNRRIEK